jgi:hypothetical protein
MSGLWRDERRSRQDDDFYETSRAQVTGPEAANRAKLRPARRLGRPVRISRSGQVLDVTKDGWEPSHSWDRQRLTPFGWLLLPGTLDWELGWGGSGAGRTGGCRDGVECGGERCRNNVRHVEVAEYQRVEAASPDDAADLFRHLRKQAHGGDVGAFGVEHVEEGP